MGGGGAATGGVANKGGGGGGGRITIAANIAGIIADFTDDGNINILGKDPGGLDGVLEFLNLEGVGGGSPPPAIPEPSALLLFGIGTLGIIGMGYRRRRKQPAANHYVRTP
jgi:hypothetical protein